MREKIKTYYLQIAFSIVGAVLGIIYWKYWGCRDGCPIRSNWWMMLGYGILLGWLLGGILKDLKEKKEAGKS